MVHAEIIENDPRIKITTIEPARDVGYTVGDIIARTIILDAPKPFQLLETSLPVPGNEKKRKNVGLGIELRSASVEKTNGISSTQYILHLTYQVFTNNIVAKPGSLPAEIIKFAKPNEVIEFRVPSWSFRISPLAVYGSVIVEKDMSPYHGPFFKSTEQAYKVLWVLMGVCAVSLLGLFYVLGNVALLPRMRGAFAQAYRDIKKLPENEAGVASALERLHQAMNQTASGSVFNAHQLMAIKPVFLPIKSDIDAFFSMSGSVFFGNEMEGREVPTVAWLKSFCRRCRDCERGLK